MKPLSKSAMDIPENIFANLLESEAIQYVVMMKT